MTRDPRARERAARAARAKVRAERAEHALAAAVATLERVREVLRQGPCWCDDDLPPCPSGECPLVSRRALVRALGLSRGP